MTRTQLYLGGLLLVQVVLILVVHSPFSAAPAGYESRLLLPALAEATPARLSIDGRNGESIQLVHGENAWGIEDLGGFPADGKKVQTLLDELEGLRVRRPVVTSTRYHEAFKVEDGEHEARIRLGPASGEPQVDLIVGSSPNFRACHVRLAGEDAVYEVRGLSPYDLQPTPSSWIQRELVDVQESRIVGVTLTNPAGSFEIAKHDGTWTLRSPAGAQKLDPAKVESLLTTLASIRLSDAAGAVDPAHGLASPAARAVLRWNDGDEAGAAVHETTVEIGAELPGEESKRYITRKDFGFTGIVWESAVRRLLEETPDSLAGAGA